MNNIIVKFLALLLIGASAQVSAQSWLVQTVTAPNPQHNMFFGLQVKVSGTTAFVSAPGENINGNASQGAVYVYTRNSNYQWVFAQKLTANDGSAGAQFGSGVALDGDRAIITAPLATQDGKTWQGNAYYFIRLNNTWVQVEKIWLYDGAAYDTFGNTVAMSSSYAFISSGGSTTTSVPGGTPVTAPRAVHVFDLGATGAFGPVWRKIQTINSPVVDQYYGYFGSAMATSGTTVLIGARAQTIAGDIGRGAVYEYLFNGTSWVPGAQLTASDGAARDNFGISIAMEGNMAMIGAYGAATNGNVSQGAVYRFEKPGTFWVPQQKLLAADGTAANLFGASLSISQGRALTGAYSADNYRGSAYLFKKGVPDWTQNQKFVAPTRVAGSVFGYYSSLDGGTALISSYNFVVNGVSGAGMAYFFTDPCWPNPNICVAKTQTEASD